MNKLSPVMPELMFRKEAQKFYTHMVKWEENQTGYVQNKREYRKQGNSSWSRDQEMFLAIVTNWQELLGFTESISGSDTIVGPSSELRETVTCSIMSKEFRIARA